MKYYYSDFYKELDLVIKQFDEYRPDIILSIARGGLIFGTFLAYKLDIRELYSINSIHYDDKHKLKDIKVYNIPDLGKNKQILIVDDIIDSGDTMVEILKNLKKLYPENEYKVATLFYKKDALLEPDFTLHEACEWIEFFWEGFDEDTIFSK